MKRYSCFFIISLALAASPGPDIFFVLAQSLAGGWKAGSSVALGLCAGLLFHVSLAAFGAAAALRRFPGVFKAITWSGAVYLIWLGVLECRTCLFATAGSGADTIILASPVKLFMRGIIMNMLNPKVMLFFLALMPKFTEPERGNVSFQFIALGTVFAAATALVFLMVAFGGHAVAGLLSGSGNARTVLHGISAMVMFSIATWIAAGNLKRDGRREKHGTVNP